jgi:hypothetical protein
MPFSDITMRANERAVIVEAANLIARSARARVAWSTKIRNAISISEVVEWQSGLGIYVKVDLSQAPEARAFEYGSGLRATRQTPSPRQEGAGGFIIIAPRNAQSLVFPGTHAWQGMTIQVPPMGGGVVHHPGVSSRPYIKPATDENRPRIREILRKAVRTSVSQTIRTSWYHSE